MNLKKFITFFSKEAPFSTQLSASEAAIEVQPVSASETAEKNREENNRFLALRTELMGQLSALHNAAIVSETDLQGNITFANEIFCQVSGYTLPELLGQNHRIIKSDVHPNEVFVDLWKTISKGNVWKAQVTNKAKDGTLYHVLSTITPILDLETQKPVKYVSVRFEITKQVEQEKELRKQTLRVNELNEKLADTLAIVEEQFDEKSKALAESVNYSKRIQNALLPAAEQLKAGLPAPFELEVLFQPKDEVSGDFYWLGERANRTVFAVGDGTGHGVPGAFLSILGITTLRNLAQERFITDPAQLLDEADAEIRNILRQKTQSTCIQDSLEMAVCTLMPGKKQIQYAAGMLKSYLVSAAGELTELPADRRPVGGTQFGDAPFTGQTVNFAPGDTLYIFSDGFVTQLGGSDTDAHTKKFGAKAFREILTTLAGEPDLKRRMQILRDTLAGWKGQRIDQTDDVLVAALRCNE